MGYLGIIAQFRLTSFLPTSFLPRYVDPDGQEALPPVVRDMLLKFAPSAVTAIGSAGRAVGFTQKILGLERTLGLVPPMVVPGPNSPEQEVQQANVVARMTGNDVLLVDNPNQQGFDALQIVGGFVNAQSANPDGGPGGDG